jgi:hypothetical protein
MWVANFLFYNSGEVEIIGYSKVRTVLVTSKVLQKSLADSFVQKVTVVGLALVTKLFSAHVC